MGYGGWGKSAERKRWERKKVYDSNSEKQEKTMPINLAAFSFLAIISFWISDFSGNLIFLGDFNEATQSLLVIVNGCLFLLIITQLTCFSLCYFFPIFISSSAITA